MRAGVHAVSWLVLLCLPCWQPGAACRGALLPAVYWSLPRLLLWTWMLLWSCCCCCCGAAAVCWRVSPLSVSGPVAMVTKRFFRVPGGAQAERPLNKRRNGLANRWVPLGMEASRPPGGCLAGRSAGRRFGRAPWLCSQ